MRPNYRESEVRSLIESYAAFAEKKDTTPRGLHYLAVMSDLDQALARLPLRQWEVILLVGLVGVPQAEAARLLHISNQAVSKRYRQGLEEVLYLINGGS